MNEFVHYIKDSFDWKTKCKKFVPFLKTTIFVRCVTCPECLIKIKGDKT